MYDRTRFYSACSDPLLKGLFRLKQELFLIMIGCISGIGLLEYIIRLRNSPSDISRYHYRPKVNFCLILSLQCLGCDVCKSAGKYVSLDLSYYIIHSNFMCCIPVYYRLPCPYGCHSLLVPIRCSSIRSSYLCLYSVDVCDVDTIHFIHKCHTFVKAIHGDLKPRCGIEMLAIIGAKY
jgi:hypothetical protein